MDSIFTQQKSTKTSRFKFCSAQLTAKETGGKFDLDRCLSFEMSAWPGSHFDKSASAKVDAI
jgi:hypothetical protein